MIDSFPTALAAVCRWEVGLSDHPADPAGLTKWGVSLRFLRAIGFDANGGTVVNGRDILALTEPQVAELYHTHFWVVCVCDQLPAGLDLAVFDCAVNQGPARAKRLLQAALGAKIDGAIGPRTLAAAETGEIRDVLTDFMSHRALHYSSLAKLAVFGLGWFRRLFDIHWRALALV